MKFTKQLLKELPGEKILAQGFKAGMPLIENAVRTAWNKVREIPEPLCLLNMGNSLDYWEPTCDDKRGMKEAVAFASTLRANRAAGMTEFISVAEIHYQQNTTGQSKEEFLKNYKRENEGICLLYMSSTEVLSRQAKIVNAKVRYLSLPFNQYDEEKGFTLELHPRLMIFHDIPEVVEKLLAVYMVPEEYKDEARACITETFKLADYLGNEVKKSAA